jgi:metal-responsive CopG/Arc/MetJ family transcriptional regulator
VFQCFRSPAFRTLEIFTCLRDTLDYVTEHQNVTLSLPKPLLRKLRVYAAERGQSMSSILAEEIRKMVVKEDEYEKAKRRMLARLKNPPNLGTGGKITWTREELHER